MSFYDCTFLDEVQFVLMMSAVVLILLLLSLFSILIPDPYSILRLQYLVIDISICIVIARLFIVSTYSFIITKMGGMCLVFLPLIGVVACSMSGPGSIDDGLIAMLASEPCCPATKNKDTISATPLLYFATFLSLLYSISLYFATKSFTLTRQLSNWNTSYIEGQIRSLIASTGYNKPITVTFPVKYSKIVVYPPRSNSFNSFFTTLVSPLLDKKRYEVVRAVWPYASLPPGPAANTSRVPVVQTEEMWWEEWRDVLRWAIVSKRSSGWVSVDDMLDFKMAPA